MIFSKGSPLLALRMASMSWGAETGASVKPRRGECASAMLPVLPILTSFS